MVIHAPEEEAVTTLSEMTDKLLDPGECIKFTSIQTLPFLCTKDSLHFATVPLRGIIVCVIILLSVIF